MILGGDPNCKSVELGAKKEGEKGVARLEVCNWDVCGKVNITSLSPFCHALARPFEGIGRKPYTESWKLDHNPSATVNIRIDNTISEIPQILDFKPKCNGFEIPEDGTLDKEKKHEDNSWVRGAKKMLRPYVPGRCQMEKECKIIRLEGLAGFEVIEETMVDEVMLEDFEWDLQLFG
ncbi:hypothetical protein M7I_7942 [Glarea lozoyensis 74030]|nr:hypothetical protein M7I_7942 [Glarea lozoyensis 74030]